MVGKIVVEMGFVGYFFVEYGVMLFMIVVGMFIYNWCDV